MFDATSTLDAETPAEDATMDLVHRLADPSLWDIRKGVPIFCERAEVDPESGEQVTFGEQELETLAANCNAMDARGDFITAAIGHTDRNSPEKDQPPVCGFVRNFRVGRFGPAQRLAILADEWIDKAWSAIAKSYPFRSVERWSNPAWDIPDFFRPVSLLRREPELKLGVVSYQAGTKVVRYSAETYMSAPPAPPPAAAPAAPAAPAAEAPAPDPVAADKQKFHEYAMSHGCLGGMIKKYAAENNVDEMGNPAEPAAPEQAAAEGPGTPSATNVKPPGSKDDDENGMVEKLAAMPPDALKAMWVKVSDVHEKHDTSAKDGKGYNQGAMKGKWPSKNAAGGDSVHYAAMEREVADLKDWKAKQEAEVAKAQGEARVQKYSADLHQLKAQGYTFDHDEVLSLCKPMSPEQFEAQKAVLVKYGTKVPIRYGAAPVERNIPTGGKPAGATAEQCNAAKRAASKNPAKYGYGEDAFTKALADVKAGTV